MNIRKRLEEREEHILSPFAQRSNKTRGRLKEEPECDIRPAFQHDRDRITHSKSFRRLKHKTQVFLAPTGDHYRTRLTHTLEVAQHARTFARVLGLNEDLCEAIAYAHDLGHTPFGHAGEEALDEIMKDDGGFEHNLQSLRVVDCLEKRYVRYDGLNLCYETREGIALHQTTHDHPSPLEEFSRFSRPSLEAQAVNIADPLAYCAHDLEDALNAGFLAMEDIRGMGIPLVDRILRKCEEKYRQFETLGTILQARLLVRTLIEEANILVLEETSKNLNYYKIHTAEEARRLDRDLVAAPVEVRRDFDALKAYLFDNVYKRPQVWIMNEKGKIIVRRIFGHIEKSPMMMPLHHRARYGAATSREARRRAIVDYIASMTDRYAMDLYKMMFAPYEKIMFQFRD